MKMKNRRFYQKSWYYNMDNVIRDFRHMSEYNVIDLIHMNKKTRIDRTGPYCRCFRWR